MAKGVYKYAKRTYAKVDTSQCRKCLYRPSKHMKDSGFGCFYIFYKGQKRPSEPSPNCTAFEPYDRKKRRAMDRELRKIEGIGGYTYISNVGEGNGGS